MEKSINSKQKLYIDLLEFDGVELEVSLVEKADLELLVVLDAQKTLEREFKLKISHETSGVKSKVKMFAALDQDSKVKILCNLVVPEGVKGVSTSLEQRAILLSKTANITFDPVLEIDENEVEASHAATISTPEEVQLHYLDARGLPRKEAVELIVMNLLKVTSEYTKMEV